MPLPVGRLVRGAMATSAGIGLAVLTCATARAVPTYTVSFDDPDRLYSAYYQAITSNVQAAGAEWANALGARGDAGINVQVGFGSNPTASGSSLASHGVGQDAGLGVVLYEQGAAAKLKGAVPNGPGPDVRLTIGETYLASELWFDPTPAARDGAVPAAKTDAYSIFLHELGHVYAFNGWRDDDGALPGAYASTFDRWVVQRGDDLFFEGPQAVLAHGGPVPLTRDDYRHLGNAAGLPGADLAADLMGGVHFQRGTRYAISALDLAIAADAGLGDFDALDEISAPYPAVASAGAVGAGADSVAVIAEAPSLVLLWAGLCLAALLHRVHRRSPSLVPSAVR